MTFLVDAIDLGEVGSEDLTLDLRGAVVIKDPAGHFGQDNHGHVFRDRHGTCDGLRVLGGRFDLSAQAGEPGDTVSAFFLVRCHRLFFALSTFENGIEEGAKLYKCREVTWVSPRVRAVRNNGIQCHAPAVDGFLGSKENLGWARWRIFGGDISSVDDGHHGTLDGQGITFNSTDPTVVCEDVLVEGVVVKDCLRGIWSEFNHPETRASRLSFKNNLVLRSKWHGIGMVGVLDGEIVGNHVIDTGENPPGPGTSSEIAGIVVSGSPNAQSEGVRVERNYVADQREVSERRMEYGLLTRQVQGLETHDNTVEGAVRESRNQTEDEFSTKNSSRS